MTEDIARFLLTPAGRDLIAEAENLRLARADTLTALTRLRRLAMPEQAAAAWDMADLRWRGVAKFGAAAGQMYFTREAGEQASGVHAAAYHARRFADAGLTEIADLCGGIGGDALAFAAQGLDVTLYENDPARALFARENARVHGLEGRVTLIEADVTTEHIKAPAAWFDPARRRNSRRVVGPEDYAPPLSFLATLAAKGVSHVGVKLSPAVSHALAGRYGAELEFLSEGGECKEALLWQGALRTGAPLQVTQVGMGGTRSLRGPEDSAALPGEPGEGRYLYEPDPAVVRAHLVRTVGAKLGASPVHPEIAYLLGPERVATPWATGYEVLEEFPWSRRQLQKALDSRGVGRVIIKKRGFPQEPEEVRRGLKLGGSEKMIVILTRRGAGHHVFLCRLLPSLEGGRTGRSSSG